MPLVSMATEKEIRPEAYAENPYGYGLCINLSTEQCEALGITAPPKAGTVVMLSARAFVTSATSTVDEEGDEGPDCYMSLQITDLELSAAKSAVKGLYKTEGGDDA